MVTANCKLHKRMNEEIIKNFQFQIGGNFFMRTGLIINVVCTDFVL